MKTKEGLSVPSAG